MMLCECGCGLPAPIATRTNPQYGCVRGQPQRFVRGHSRRLPVGREYDVRPGPLDTPCHIWRGKVDATTGYGHAQRDGRQVTAHRFIYEREVGPVPEGRKLHHRCEVKPCVNVEHLEPLTQREHSAAHR